VRARDVLVGLSVMAAPALAVACSWDPSNGFQRESPAVNEALSAYDAGDAGAATTQLEAYLSTGACKEGKIEAGDFVRRRADGTFDLGLSLFRVGESFGRRFGEEEVEAGAPSQDVREKRSLQIECGLKLARIVANDDSLATELRARGHYLAGNLLFLDQSYKEAVREYDQAITISPGYYDSGDPVGADAAWNRSIALRRIDDKNRDAGNDSGQDASPDAPNDAKEDAPNEAGQDSGKDSGGEDSGNDAGDSGSDSGQGGNDGGGSDGGGRDSGGSSAEKPPPSRNDQDERTLDSFENAPSVQQQDAKNARKHLLRGWQDK